MYKKGLSIFMLSIIGACATQPDWVLQKRNYPNWQASHSDVKNFDFNWHISGQAAFKPVQVFNAGNEVWLQMPDGLTQVPTIIGQSDKGQQVLKVWRNPPYLVVKGQWQHLLIRQGDTQVVAIQQALYNNPSF